ncbi:MULTISPECIES: protein-L-isoaspartate O-methyltransferase family protein [unclassified Bartonella]|uniref:protein-L-isoaspartate O-methyltransferase family protein n=1 Tax=unclassified Bartonella TaxID=2645622 RepID=UPI0021C7A64C|nr:MULTISPECIES: protein-L-isoaspartate O-methyltransferase [unclassified Bartonella]UXN04331.1 protein-L-isoaspartate O-methyltransferase [Bartonella sp. HY406]UXN07324.1 protein-L-isoaspartate O-methyltransferase [Bartonella sp. HY761]
MNIDYAELRRKMVDNQVRTVDVTRLSVLAALLAVPREAFVLDDFKKFSYVDEDVEVKAAENGEPARFIMEAAPFAKLLQLADVSKKDIILDIGCTTGYSAAVLSELGSSVIALESDEALAQAAKNNLDNNGYDNVVVINGVLQDGYKNEAPFDVIVIEGSVDFVPENLFSQLREGGRLVVVVGHGNAGVAQLFIKEDGVISVRRGFNLAVKPLAGFLNKPKFVF